LFPSSFQCICDTQGESGGWEGGDPIDEIVNTMACLLAMKRHHKAEMSEDEDDISKLTELAEKIDKAKDFLVAKFSDRKPSNTEGVAFDILIPSMLDLLEVEGLQLRFPNSEELRQRNQTRMSKINFSVLYRYPSAILHSLESFIGAIDFDKMSHHLQDGGMMASPSSTAAYLMNASTWDDNAERYLRDAVENGRRIAEGMVTNVFPISTFEFAWVYSAMSLLMAVDM